MCCCKPPIREVPAGDEEAEGVTRSKYKTQNNADWPAAGLFIFSGRLPLEHIHASSLQYTHSHKVALGPQNWRFWLSLKKNKIKKNECLSFATICGLGSEIFIYFILQHLEWPPGGLIARRHFSFTLVSSSYNTAFISGFI